MEKEKLQQQIAIYYSKLPKELQEVFSTMQWLENLKQLSVKYGLKEDQIQTLGTETTLVLLGIIHIDEYRAKVKSELGLTLEQSNMMLGEINDLVLANLVPKLSETFTKNARELEENSEITEGLDERFDKLPEEIKKMILEMNYHAKIYAISQENRLSIPQMGYLEEAITNTINGNIHPEEFEEELKNYVGVPGETAKKLLDTINTDILKPIREKMEKVYVKPKGSITDIKKSDLAPLGTGGAQTRINIITPVTNARQINKPDLNAMELKEGNPKVDQKMQSVFAQKLSGSVQSDTVKTDYTLGSAGKTSNDPAKPKYTVDPYRIIPE